MAENDDVNPLEIFAEEASDENVQVQIQAIRKLPTIAVVLDVDSTRKNLIPFLEQYIDSNFLHDEVLLAVGEQLQTFVPFVGGSEHVDLILRLLKKLCVTDETVVRDCAVQSLVHIAGSLDGGVLEKHFVPLIEELAAQEWFTSKCSASGLFEVCYPKVSTGKQMELRKLFQLLIQDEQPMIRRASAENFAKFSCVIDVESLKTEFVPILENLTKDNQDSVRVLAVNVALGIASRLTTKEVEELLLKHFEQLAADTAWRVRCQVANQIHHIQTAVGPEISIKHLLPVLQSLGKDDEPQVREEIAKNLPKFCENLKPSERFEEVFQEHVLGVVKALHSDFNTHVRAVMASKLMSLVPLVTAEVARNEFVPMVKTSVEQEQFGIVKENLARNLEALIDVMGTADVMASVQKLMEDLIYKSDSNWRTRRNVLLTFTHIAKRCEKQFFNENLRELYLRLLYDPVYAVRKTAPLILPVLFKHFGTSWGFFTVEMVLPFVEDHNYLYRYIPIFSINEIVHPSLDGRVLEGGILRYLKTLDEFTESEDVELRTKALKVLARVKIYQKLLTEAFEEPWMEKLHDPNLEEFPPDNIRVYAEDVFDAFTEHETYSILDVTQKELEGTENTYLEGILYLCLRHFLRSLRKLTEDKVSNVPVKAWDCLRNIESFSVRLGEELKEEWVSERLSQLSPEEVADLERAIKLGLVLKVQVAVEEVLDLELQNPFEVPDSKEVSGETTTKMEEEPKSPTSEDSLAKQIVEIFDNKLGTLVKKP